MGHLALVTGLSGDAAEARIAAADAWTRIALSGRLDPALAAEAISLGVSGGALKLSRIADGLRHAAAEPVAAAGVAQACVSAAARQAGRAAPATGGDRPGERHVGRSGASGRHHRPRRHQERLEASRGRPPPGPHEAL